jgi:hypothetical protein
MDGKGCQLLFFLSLLICWVDMNVAKGMPGTVSEKTRPEDGVDVSFPQHHYLDPNTWQGKRYKKFITGCYDKFKKSICDATEIARINQNFDQPRGEHNYTEVGFKKIRVPDHVWSIIKEFWDTNKDKEELEKWPPGNTYTNNWDTPTYMVSLENRKLRGGDGSTKKKIWNGIRPLLEEWSGERLTETSLYGIRVYKDGAMLSSHVDRLPLVTSCIVHVDSDIDEPWPIEVISHDGKAFNVTMTPGDMVLYESHTVIHGRPTPLKGRFYANVFVHFAPVDHDKINEEDHRRIARGETLVPHFHTTKEIHHALKTENKNGIQRKSDVNKAFKDHQINSNSRKTKISGHEQANHDTEEIALLHAKHGDELDKHDADLEAILHKTRRDNTKANSKEEEEEEDLDHISVGPAHPGPNILLHKKEKMSAGSHVSKEDMEENNNASYEEDDEEDGRLYKFLPLNEAAARGDTKTMKALLKEFPHTVRRKDINGWTALHEAARGGHTDTVKLLVESGAKLGARTNRGESALWWARHTLPAGHSVMEFLEGQDAPEVGGL